VLEPGLATFFCPFQTIAIVNTKVRQLDVWTDSKTNDDVTVKMRTSIQYFISNEPTSVYNAHFKLSDPAQQMGAYVDDVVRSQLPKYNLDQAFEEKERIGTEIQKSLQQNMDAYGIVVHRALVTDLKPDASVVVAMNNINANKRLRAAALERAEAEKITIIKAAEADAEAKKQSGLGIAKMRNAITQGFSNSISGMTNESGKPLGSREVMHMMMVTQYLDTLKDFAGNGKSSMVVTHTPAGLAEIESQMRAGFVEAQAMDKLRAQ